MSKFKSNEEEPSVFQEVAKERKLEA